MWDTTENHESVWQEHKEVADGVHRFPNYPPTPSGTSCFPCGRVQIHKKQKCWKCSVVQAAMVKRETELTFQVPVPPSVDNISAFYFRFLYFYI